MILPFFYLFCLFIGSAASFWQMVLAFRGRRPGGIVFRTEQQKNYAFLFLWVYVTANFVAEFLSFSIMPGYYNQATYCMNMLVHSFALFTFYCLVLRTKLILYCSIVVMAIMLTEFLVQGYWYVGTWISSLDVAAYFVMVASVSSVFLRQVLTRPDHQRNRFCMRLGTLCTIYFALGSVTISFSFLWIEEITPGDTVVYYANLLVNLVYYFLFALLMIRNIIRI